MIRGFYTAGSGMSARQTSIDNIANNISNISTAGYKKQKAAFTELLYSNMITPDNGVNNNPRVGNGTRISQIDSIFTDGSIIDTGRELDFAICGEGFFGVMDGGGEIFFTRDGNFSLSIEEEGNFLVNSSGLYVLDNNMNRIVVDMDNLQASLINLGVFGFDNKYGLIPQGGNLFSVSSNSGDPTVVETPQVLSGCLESSNVNLSDEMSRLIEIQRGFQLNSRLVQTADEIENIINNLR